MDDDVVCFCFPFVNISGTPSVSNNFAPDQAGHFVGHHLGPSCFQRLTAGDFYKIHN